MNKKYLSTLIGFCLFSVGLTAAFKVNMISFRSTLLDIAPFIYSAKEYENPKNQKKIKQGLEKLVKIGHKLDPDVKKKLSDKDPSLNYIVAHLEDDFKSSLEAFNEKKFSYSQNVIKSAINRCFQCHSQNFRQNQSMTKLEPKNLELLSTEEKVDLLVAVRNFKEARRLLEERLESIKFTKEKQYEIENLVQKFLIVSIRTDIEADKITGPLKALKKQKLPSFLTKKIDSYLDSLKDYKPSTQKNDFKIAKSLVKKADSKKDYTFDASGLVESLRAAKILHQFLNTEAGATKNQIAEAYYLLGKAYQSINEPSYWDLHESYFSRCVQSLPRTQLAKTCFKRYRDSVELRHSGSAGMFVPVRLKLRLSELQKMSGM